MNIPTLKLMLQDLILAARDDDSYSDEYNAGYNCAISNIVNQIQMLEQGVQRLGNHKLVLDDKELGIIV